MVVRVLKFWYMTTISPILMKKGIKYGIYYLKIRRVIMTNLCLTVQFLSLFSMVRKTSIIFGGPAPAM